MSAAFPEIKLNFTSVSPFLSESVNEYLSIFTRLHKVLLELIEKVGSIQDVAATEMLSVVELFSKKVVDVTKGKPSNPCESMVKFLQRFLEQIENQAKTLQNLKSSFCDCVVKPLKDAVDKKKEVWKTCFHYADTFVHQIRKKEDDLQKRFKDYSEAAMKVKAGNEKDKQLHIFYDTHNTYILRLSSVNSINNLLYTHVLPHILNSIEMNHGELNDQTRHHTKYMFSVQKDSMKKLMKSLDKIDHAADKVDIINDLRKFIKHTNKTIKDKSPPVSKFSLPKVDQSKMWIIDNIDASFIINKRTQPNLLRRLASLQHQTKQLVDSISTMRSEDGSEEKTYHCEDPSLNELIEYLCICDKEANLNVLLKQMELYTPKVLNFLGSMPENLLLERRHSKKSPQKENPVPLKNGQRPHEFIEPRVMKPISCFYCGKIIALIGKGFLCKVCKISVHKKCATNVQFCEPSLNKPNVESAGETELIKFEPAMESSVVYDLIDLESDGDYYDDDEFDDGLSDSEFVDNIPFKDTNPVLQPSKPALYPKPNILFDSNANSHTSSNGSSSSPHPFSYSKPNVQSSNSLKLNLSHTPKKPSSLSSTKKTGNLLTSKSFLTQSSTTPEATEKILHRQATIDIPLKSEATKPPVKSKKPPISKKPMLEEKISKHARGLDQENFCVSLYDFRGSETIELSFVAGCKFEVTKKSSEEWWKGTLNGYEGYFPAKYVLEIGKDDLVMHALFTFVRENEGELNIEQGDILVLVRYEDDWAVVKSKDGEGLVPASYIEPLP